MLKLFHVSDEPSEHVFEPRPAPSGPDIGNVVWAVDEPHVVNYLLPRDCPRITFAPSLRTTEADRLRFEITSQARIVVIERSWWDRVHAATVYVHEMPPAGFSLHDEDAGYWISRAMVRPLTAAAVSHLPGAIAARKAELRVVDRLRAIFDEVVDSSLSFSIIRMRNAAP